MRYLLDSNIVIAASLGLGTAVHERMAACSEGEMVTSAIVFAEVLYGSARGKPPPLERLAVLAEEVPVLPFDLKAATTYAGLPLRRHSYDQLIAAHALSLGLVVVTDNVGHFADVPGLEVENWTLPL